MVRSCIPLSGYVQAEINFFKGFKKGRTFDNIIIKTFKTLINIKIRDNLIAAK